MKRTATAIARQAIEAWLRHFRKISRDQAIFEFAKNFAGTEYDLDIQLEASGVEHLIGGVIGDIC